MQSYIPAYLRNKNRGVVLGLFMKHDKLSRADVNKLSRISFPTVMKIVDFLLEKKILIEIEGSSGISDSGLGRKGQLLRLNANAYSTIGIHFEGNYLQIGLINLAYEVLDQKAFPCSAEMLSAGGLEQISRNMTDTIALFCKLHPETTVLGVGVALPGVIDCEQKKIMKRTGGVFIPFNQSFPSFNSLQNIPVYIENDMNAASFGEIILRKDKPLPNLLYLALGTGFGGGIIIDGKIWHGSKYYAGDIGSILVNYQFGEPDTNLESKRIEKFVNIAAINKKFNVDIRRDSDTDPETKRIISDYLCSYLVPVIYNLNYVLDITNFVLAGIITDFLGDTLFERVHFGLRCLNESDKLGLNTQIFPTISKNSGITGAATIAMHHCIVELLNDA